MVDQTRVVDRKKTLTSQHWDILQDSLAEVKARQDYCTVAVVVADELEVLREKLSYWKIIRVST